LRDGESEEQHVSYGELDQLARAIGAQLQSMEAVGERVLLLYPSGLEFIAAFLGCFYGGAVAVPAYPPRMNRPDSRIKSIANDAQAALALTTSSVLSGVERRLAQNGELGEMQWLATDRVDRGLASEWRDPGCDKEALAFLQYTSGSTAAPKGVMVTHDNLMHNERVIRIAMGHDEDSTVVGWLPFHHDMGLIGNVLQPLYVGALSVLMPPALFLQKPLRWLQTIAHYRAHSSGGPNFAYDLCVRKITPQQREQLDLSSWQVAFNGAEPIRHDTMERFLEVFEPCGFRREALYPCYGMAEATLFVSGPSKKQPPVFQALSKAELENGRVVPDSREGSVTLVGCGRTSLDQKVLIVDPSTLTRCSPERIGEIWMSGPSVAQGYWNKPSETERDFGAYLSDSGEGPFLRTGDLGFLKDGELFVTGRLKDLIIIRGRNLYPQDIEVTAQNAHAGLRPGCGAAFSVEISGEERLVVVQEVDRRVDSGKLDEIVAAIRQAVALEHEVALHAIVLIKHGSILKTTSGKIQRAACRSAYTERRFNIVSEWMNPTEESLLPVDRRLSRETVLAAAPGERRQLLESDLREQVAGVLGQSPSKIDVHQPLVRLGMDSLMGVELKNRIESELRVTIPLIELIQGASVSRLAAVLVDRLTGTDSEAVSVQPEESAQQANAKGDSLLMTLMSMSKEEGD
jgi:acyl-CoA synthetase (AMP-forming)/AMP-acid ligase II/acyl carrier protein